MQNKIYLSLLFPIFLSSFLSFFPSFLPKTHPLLNFVYIFTDTTTQVNAFLGRKVNLSFLLSSSNLCLSLHLSTIFSPFLCMFISLSFLLYNSSQTLLRKPSLFSLHSSNTPFKNQIYPYKVGSGGIVQLGGLVLVL